MIIIKLKKVIERVEERVKLALDVFKMIKYAIWKGQLSLFSAEERV